MRRSFALMLALLVLGGAGCATLRDWSEPGAEELERSVSAFNKYFRWKQYAKAKLFVLPDRERSFLRFTQRIETSLDINDFSVEDVSMDDSDERAGLRKEGHAQVRLNYTQLPSNVFRKKVLEQVWVVHKGQWMLEFPEGGWDL